MSEMLKDQHDAYFIGRNLDYASVLEGALKLKEVSMSMQMPMWQVN